jgi:hypothetical protein
VLVASRADDTTDARSRKKPRRLPSLMPGRS